MISCYQKRAASKRIPLRFAFTLIELLVVISIIALLIGILLPVLGQARQTARATQCMTNLKQIEIAHYAYLTDRDGQMVDAALSHGGSSHSGETFVTELKDYWDDNADQGSGPEIRARSPLDDSSHWGPAPAGESIPGAADANQRRRTSYGLNDYLTSIAPLASQRHTRIDEVANPTSTVHIFIMSYTSDFAGADHAHATGWFRNTGPAAYVRASAQSQTHAVRGEIGSADAVSNYAFLDGHVEQAAFRTLGTGPDANKFNPDVNP